MNENDEPQDRIELKSGPFRLQCFDPTRASTKLGARYIHGGYIAECYYRDILISGRASERWDPYVGQGFPEVFESGLGWNACDTGELFLRIGVGKARKTGTEWSATGTLVEPVHWKIAKSGNSLTMACEDRIEIGRSAYAYELSRTLEVAGDTLHSESTLKISCPWSHPLVWFAHPFFGHSSGEKTTFLLPAQIENPVGLDSVEHSSGTASWRFSPQGGFTVLKGVWGYTEPLRLELDPCLNTKLELSLNRPLDKLVLYGTSRAASIEPYWARAWSDGERATWRVSYRCSS